MERCLSTEPIIIGIGGISCGGKTSICSRLGSHFNNVTTLHMDDYYWPSGSEKFEPTPEYESFYNWDCLGAIDWQRLITDIKQLISTSREQQIMRSLILVEGTMVLNYSPLTDLFSHRYFVTLPYKQAFARRRLKAMVTYEPETYFEKYVWPSYVTCCSNLRQNNNVEFLDGCMDHAVIFQRIISDIDNLFGNMRCIL